MPENMNTPSENKLNVAVIMIGNLRSNIGTFDRLKKYLFDLYNCDLYITTYNKRYNVKWADCEDQEKLVSEPETVALYKDYLKQITIVDQNEFFEKYTKLENKEYAFGGDLDRLYTIEKFIMTAYDIFRRECHTHNRRYDIVLKIRPDTYLHQELDLTMHLNDDQIVVPNVDSGAGFNDHLAFGKPGIMERYFTYYQNFAEIDQSGVDVSKIEFGLQKHLENSGVEIKRMVIKYMLRKDARQQRIMFFSKKKKDFYVKRM